MHVIYVIGVPGAGKSTLVNNALDRLGVPPTHHTQPVPHDRYDDIWYLGRRRPHFPGTDALSMSIQPDVAEWLHNLTQAGATQPRILLAEGDRLANHKFFDTVTTCGHRLTIIHLDCPPSLSGARTRDRAQAIGIEPQSFAWWKSRYTKTLNLVNSRPVTRYDATQPPSTLAANLHHQLTRP
jgi:hypothetical protein